MVRYLIGAAAAVAIVVGASCSMQKAQELDSAVQAVERQMEANDQKVLNLQALLSSTNDDNVAEKERIAREITDIYNAQADLEVKHGDLETDLDEKLVAAEAEKSISDFVAGMLPPGFREPATLLLAASGAFGVNDVRRRREKSAKLASERKTRRAFRNMDARSTSDDNGNRIVNKERLRDDNGVDLSEWIENLVASPPPVA